MEFHHFFPTTISASSIDIDLSNIKSLLKKIDLSNHTLIDGGGCSYSESCKDILTDTFGLGELRNIFQSHIDSYCKEIGIVAPSIHESWYNMTTNGGKILSHFHRGSVVTGVFYVETTTNTSPIYFENPIENLKMGELKLSNTDSLYSHGEVFISPMSGTLILFPSWLRHKTNENAKDNRITINFNTFNYET